MHTSIPVPQSVEFINITPLNPLISQCQIKVCYVSDDPNRNSSIITKESGRKLANSLPGSPIVGFYNESIGDFEGHNRIIEVQGGEFKIKDTTRPYGFVDLNAKVWFQKFEDDGVEHEYLMTEGYLWTGQYPECQRIIDKGNNQSMELDEETLDASWAKNEKGEITFFIINEAIISKLCVLGEEVEPCFEGASVTKVQFSFDDDMKQSWSSFMNTMKEILDKGGKPVFTTYAVEIGGSLWDSLWNYFANKYPRKDEYGYCYGSIYHIEGVYEDGGQKFVVVRDAENGGLFKMNFSVSANSAFIPADELVAVEKDFIPADSTPQFSAEAVKVYALEYVKKQKEKKKEEEDETEEKEDKSEEEKGEDKSDDSKGDEEESKDENEDEDEESEEDKKKKKKDKKKEYSLNDIPEYVELLNNYNLLKSENESLIAFKNSVEREKKERMINQDFYMLDDEMKKDVIDNIDTYSLEQIEAKLAILCVRNKINFNLDDDKDNNNAGTTFNLDDVDADDAGVPAWVLAAREVAKTMND